MTKIFKHILIIGGGLIGSSIARACREKCPDMTISMFDSSEGVRDTLQVLAIADKVVQNSQEVSAQADLVILAVPPASMVEAFMPIQGHLKPGAVVSDVGSVKSSIVKNLTPLMPEGAEFIGGHPIAGTEKNGPRAGFASLFEDRWCILTPESVNSVNTESLCEFWQALGSKVEFMDAARHDLVLATTSHLPHLIAFALVGTAMDMETVTRNEVVKYSAGGFRDFTRIAASDPVMWRDVFLENKDSVLEVLGRYIEDLTALKRSIRWGEGDALLEQFAKTRDIRRRILDAGEDSNVVNFGRDGINE